ncbi:MAG: ATPase domain-containing protein [Candidatus Woesearchaeota archaeon]
MSIERVSTGIIGMDSLLQGGFKKKSVNLVAGGAGTGKTIFSAQFVHEGLKKGESALYITFEEKKDKFYEEMEEFGWDFKKYENEKKFVFLEYTPEQVKNVLIEGGGDVEAIVERIKPRRLVIDSVTSFSLLYEDDLTKKEAALALFELINKWNCTGVLTSQEVSREGHTVSTALEFEVDGIIILYHVKSKGIRHRAIEVLKVRGTKIPEKTISMDITTKGIIVHPEIVVVF